ncbi:MAG TPA: hypothetical protein VFL34_20195, partial [Candidatus Sulfotelmatobacter sp.]|nr:hypothetical protein [Candidatus Sulfotelmatobacter sp.]
MIGRASTRSLRPTPALKTARGRFTVVGMTGGLDGIGDLAESAVIARLLAFTLRLICSDLSVRALQRTRPPRSRSVLRR